MTNCIRSISPTTRNVAIVATVLVVISAVAVAALYKHPIDCKKFNWPSRRVCLIGGAGVLAVAGAVLVQRASATKPTTHKTFRSRDKLEKAFAEIPQSGQGKVKLEKNQEGVFCDQNQTRLDAPRQACFINGEKVTAEQFLRHVEINPLVNEYANQALAASLLSVVQSIFTMKTGEDMVYYMGGHGHFMVNVVPQNGKSLVESVYVAQVLKIDEELGTAVACEVVMRTLIEPGADEAVVTWEKIENKPRMVNLTQAVGQTISQKVHEVKDEDIHP